MGNIVSDEANHKNGRVSGGTAPSETDDSGVLADDETAQLLPPCTCPGVALNRCAPERQSRAEERRRIFTMPLQQRSTSAVVTGSRHRVRPQPAATDEAKRLAKAPVAPPPHPRNSKSAIRGTEAFKTTTLASYVTLNDNLRFHEEQKRRRSTGGDLRHNVQQRKIVKGVSEGPTPALINSPTVTFALGGPANEYLNLRHLLQATSDPTTSSDIIQPRRFLPTNSEGKIAESTELAVYQKLDVSDYLVLRRRDKHSRPIEVRGGPKPALVVFATQSTSLIYQEAFLATYRSFISAQELIARLIIRYIFMMDAADMAGSDGEKKESKFHYFSSSHAAGKAARQTFSMLVRIVDDLCAVELTRELIHAVTSFVYRLIRQGHYDFARLLRRRLMERIEEKSAMLRRMKQYSHSPLMSDVDGGGVEHPTSASLSVLDFRSQVLAEQITCLDQELFGKIEPAEMLWWAQSQDEARSPNLVIFTEHFNRLSYWVRTQVLRPMEQKERERWLWKFIKVMRHLRRMGNFNSYLAILSALDSGPMRRLDWSRHMRSELSEHAEVMDSSHSFRNYRQLLAEQPPPCLPYIGLILQDLTFVHVGNPDKLHVPMPSDSPDGVGGATVELVNYGKRWQQFAILDNVRRFKAWPYPLERDERVIRGALHNFQPALDEEETWTRSFELKPKRASSNVNC